ncbi:MAG: TatD family hydrolase [Christensenellales bacterium]
MIIDSHAHVNDAALDGVRQQILQESVSIPMKFCEVGFDYDSSLKAVELAEQNANVYAIIGTHPQEAEKLTDWHLEEYRRLSGHNKVVALGEIGLDYHYPDPPKESQLAAFERQLQLATTLDLPVVLHVRESYKDTFDLLSQYAKDIKRGILLHCYSGSAESVKLFDKLDCYYALGGAVTFKNAKKEDVIRAIRPDRLLLETDCPYMTPVPYRGTPNRPQYVRLVAQKIAQVLGVSEDSVIESTEKNTRRLFYKIKD